MTWQEDMTKRCDELRSRVNNVQYIAYQGAKYDRRDKAEELGERITQLWMRLRSNSTTYGSASNLLKVYEAEVEDLEKE